MKRIFTLLTLAGVVYLSSCSKGEDNTNLNVVPKEDSITKGSYVTDTIYGLDTFKITDLTVQNSPVYELTAVASVDKVDSIWTVQILVNDAKSKLMSMNLTAKRPSPDLISPLGVYTVVSNGSTLTDYAHGENKTLGVETGGTVEVTYSTAGVLVGNMHFMLRYNYKDYQCVGAFKIATN